ncbi:hypothetical protein ABPG75_013473 [Micractinium tetrahymenae]
MEQPPSCISPAAPTHLSNTRLHVCRARKQRGVMAQAEALRAVSLERLQKCGLGAQEARALLEALHETLRSLPGPSPAPLIWHHISKRVLHPGQPFALHKLLFQATYAHWDAGTLGPPPAWVPTAESMAATNAARFMATWPGDAPWQELRTGDPAADWPLVQRLSFSSPEAFWPHLLRHLSMRFHTPPLRMLEWHDDPDSCRWLPRARFNIAECALTGHDPDRPAVVWADEAAPTVLRSMRLGELARRSAHVADALRAAGLHPGDGVAINAPMTATAVIAYLGIVLAGCAAVSIADSFVAGEVASRLRTSQAKAIFTQDVILRGGQALPLYARVVEAGGPRAVVLPAAVHGRLQVELRPGDASWQAFLGSVPEPAQLHAHVAAADDTAGILFSSGTTGEPKAIPWAHTTTLRCAANAFFHQDVRRGDVVCWPTSMGWMLGPWLVYATLLNGATIALFHGSPQGRPFGEFVAAAHVTMLGVVPSIVKGWRAGECMQGLDWSCIRCYSSAGEASAPDDVLWLMARAGYKPVIDSCGGTEIAGSFLTGSPLQPQAPATFSTPAVGHCPVILVQQPDDSQRLSIHGEDSAVVSGELAILAPALGTSQRLLNADHHQVYFAGMPPAGTAGTAAGTAGATGAAAGAATRVVSSGAARAGAAPAGAAAAAAGRWFLRRHGDAFERLPGGSYRALGRLDDTMNLGGIKVSSLELEQACIEGVEGVVEAAAVACPTPGGGPEQLHLFLVLRPGVAAASAAELQRRCREAISSKLNPLFRVQCVLVRRELPRNASNKVLRQALREELLRSQSKL